LGGRVLEMRGKPLSLLRRLANADEDVQAVQMFGDRLHIRVREDSAPQVIRRLKRSIPSGGGQVTQLHSIPPQLEDVFIALLEPPDNS